VASSSEHGTNLCIPLKVRNVFIEPLSGSQEAPCSVEFVTDKNNEITVKDIAVIKYHDPKTCGGSSDVTQHNIDLGNRWR
jgi:hypothetical protein